MKRPLSHRQIAKLLGCSHALVIQIEVRAMRKLRVLLEERGLTVEELFR